MTKSEYATIWRNVRRNCCYELDAKYNIKYRKIKNSNVFFGLTLFDTEFAGKCNGEPLCYEEYEYFMWLCEDVIKNLYFKITTYTVWQDLVRIESVRKVQYYMYRKLKNTLIKKQKEGEELSQEELAIVNWDRIY